LPAKPGIDQVTERVRTFNRFYTQQIGILQKGYLKSPFSLADVRVLFELAHREKPTATEISVALGLDAGYLSRILLGFEKRGLIARKPSAADARQNYVSLTRKGQTAFAQLDRKSHAEISAMLSKLTSPGRQRLVEAMHTIQELLGAKQDQKVSYMLRSHQPGDMGWVIHRHGALYAQEYGWDERFEALVAEIAAKFIQNFDAKRERCWIAEKDGEIVGSAFLVRQSATVAKLRLLLVEPAARGLGLGRRLVEECIRFARQAGYRKITLWTQSSLNAARHIYKKAGFEIVKEEAYQDFGHDHISETWELIL
jgi:DNA-binding MarR family transcriptional regulator/N-acetylglutamate synthase-like GNAT family acetyltransferase